MEILNKYLITLLYLQIIRKTKKIHKTKPKSMLEVESKRKIILILGFTFLKFKSIFPLFSNIYIRGKLKRFHENNLQKNHLKVGSTFFFLLPFKQGVKNFICFNEEI